MASNVDSQNNANIALTNYLKGYNDGRNLGKILAAQKDQTILRNTTLVLSAAFDFAGERISDYRSIFRLNVLGAGLIAGSTIGLRYIKPEYKKARIGLQTLFIAGLASVMFAAFKAYASSNLLREF